MEHFILYSNPKIRRCRIGGDEAMHFNFLTNFPRKNCDTVHDFFYGGISRLYAPPRSVIFSTRRDGNAHVLHSNPTQISVPEIIATTDRIKSLYVFPIQNKR